MEIRGKFFHRCPAWRGRLVADAAPESQSAVSPGDCLWEVAPFYSAVLNMDATRWLDSRGGHKQLGSQCVNDLARILCPGLPVRWFPSAKMEAADGARGRAFIEASEGSAEIPSQRLSLVQRSTRGNVAAVEDPPDSAPGEPPPLEFHPGLGEPNARGDQGPESAPSRPLVPFTTNGANSWLGAWAFLMRPGHIKLYAKGKCAEICKVPPCRKLRLGEPVAVLQPCRGVKDEEGQLCHRIWGIGRWGWVRISAPGRFAPALRASSLVTPAVTQAAG